MHTHTDRQIDRPSLTLRVGSLYVTRGPMEGRNPR